MDKLTHHLGYSPRRIVVFRALKLGDLLCSVPAFRALRHAFPDAHIALLSLPWAAEFVQLFPDYFDEFIDFPGWPGLPEQVVDPVRTVAFLAQMQTRHWDVAIQMQGNGTFVNGMLSLFGAGAVAGYFPQTKPEERMGEPSLWLPYPEKAHEVKRHVQLMTFLGLDSTGYELEFPEIATPVALPAALQTLDRPYVCIHAGGISGRRWPEASFAEVADQLADQGFAVVLTGSLPEQTITQTVQQHMRHPAIDLAGQTTLTSLAAVLRQSALLVSNDTGVSHVAVACHVPSLVIFTSADPAEWGPLNEQRHRVIREADATPARVASEALRLYHALT
ncbi:glycosyltransferase family 9 protein [Spirosoma rhododendri]|uniref:Glycosyltransferase family 9 protein n=1 Tax=Spirosoma rhododendri TaxID=2728024 RepID=A0A7L5DQL0_9BACT|nr:glycosyltransferase family 9 protein [Spirosoma rhododendri]QJD79882.1 glycosyltransferase family 9 protein [Spirosoma rhododendri]